MVPNTHDLLQLSFIQFCIVNPTSEFAKRCPGAQREPAAPAPAVDGELRADALARRGAVAVGAATAPGALAGLDPVAPPLATPAGRGHSPPSPAAAAVSFCVVCPGASPQGLLSLEGVVGRRRRRLLLGLLSPRSRWRQWSPPPSWWGWESWPRPRPPPSPWRRRRTARSPAFLQHQLYFTQSALTWQGLLCLASWLASTRLGPGPLTPTLICYITPHSICH